MDYWILTPSQPRRNDRKGRRGLGRGVGGGRYIYSDFDITIITALIKR